MIKSILIVDDQPLIRLMLRKNLCSIGEYTIQEAENGKQAFSLVTENHFDAIFCDINMPGSDGLYLLQQLGAIRFTGEIVLISGEDHTLLSSTKALTDSYGLTIIGACQKPITTDKLKRIFAQHHNDTHFFSQQSPLSVSELQTALENDQISPYFQPQYSIQHNQIIGFEALARINNHQGTIPPNRFIDVAENSGLMTALTKQLIDKALSHFCQLDCTFNTVTLSLNVSSSVLEEEDFPNWLARRAQQYGIDNSRIICELTETSIADNPTKVHVSLLRLRMLHFKLSIDDFGTGYATLTQLHSLPFDELKIDRSFVFDMCTNKKSRAVCVQCIGLAQDFGLNVVAEGIEDQQTLLELKNLGCQIAQGFYFAKPTPAHIAIERVNKGDVERWEIPKRTHLA
ncbi:EAL domain-containing response regulator [Vibrio sp. qd031]|uniref:EAL domain-containing response regulator n=1 Tax=Vibrio sp. qd031 TaxID=1603038 RepID=UPI000A0FBCE5|nr:EAL domain-containing response regulator [Vibrio sp. qd031]